MNAQHTQLASGKWQTLTLCEQMANIGSEVERAIKWRKKENRQYSKLAIQRALELIDLTLSLQQPNYQRREITRVREVLVDDFYGNNQYKSTDVSWQKYFYCFTYAAQSRILDTSPPGFAKRGRRKPE